MEENHIYWQNIYIQVFYGHFGFVAYNTVALG